MQVEYKYKGLVEPLLELPGMKEALEHIKAGKNVKVIDLVNACKGHLSYGIAQFIQSPMVVITYDELSAKQLAEDLEVLKGKESVLIYPARDILFYNADVHSMDITARRLKVIEALTNEEDVVIIIPVEALLNPLSPKDTFASYKVEIEVGSSIDLTQLERKLVQMGYDRVSRVEAMGQFAIRGGIIDIYGAAEDEAYRIELWDDEVDSIRNFNVQTQRSVGKVNAIRIIPNQEIIFPLELVQKAIPAIKEDLKQVAAKLRKDGKKESAIRIEETVKEAIEQIGYGISPRGLELYAPYTDLKLVTILDYLSKNSLIFIDEPNKVREKSKRVLDEYRMSMMSRIQYGHILPKQIDLIFEYNDIAFKLTAFKKVFLMNFESEIEGVEIDYTLPINVFENNTFYKSLDLLEKDLREWKSKKKRIAILTGAKAMAMRLCDELEERGVIANYTEHDEVGILPGQILMYKGCLNKGFCYDDLGFYIIADKDLFGKDKKVKKPKKRYKGSKIQSFLDLSPGDYVVHEQYGIGVFQGIEQIVVDGISKDNLKIEYAGHNYLYVNINQMDLVQKYIGAEGKEVKLNKIGTSDWKKAKTKAKKAINNIAKELILLYSERQYQRGFKYEPDNTWQREFEELFPYEETGDQINAIEDVKKDMESNKIMDRLICGDVGYGKTEVAIRAAFKAVQNSKQVAYLVPTTILAQQHYKRFAERMENYPINVELLSRFRTPKQVKDTLKGLESGQVDIVIGTHRLLSSDVKFKDLGLVIIDEEQRFGVTHKEKLKQMRTQVDVMSLTATPIPRTLHMSLIGVRDMSVLEEAPVERKAVQTYVIEYSEDFIRDAISRELARDGQVYFLHNRVQNIEEMAERVQELVPEARVEFAHGQMHERELEQIMLSFVQGEIDVLVCTTIIETGLDIPNANTIIINGADRMGLSQLYQLRGRVGRSSRIGYAYLMYQKDRVLKEVAEKRLQAIKQFTELGAGFKIAMRDLEIRGAGNLLGAQQHGHMDAIGYDLYCKMLSQVMSVARGEEVVEEFETTIEIKINAYIPIDYITDEIQKLDIYKKIASIRNEADYMDIQEEIEDRYGNIPEVVYNLLDVALIKAMAHDLYITVINENKKQVSFIFKENAPLNSEALPGLLEKYGRKMKFVGGEKASIRMNLEDVDKKELISNIKNILHDFIKLKSVNE